MFTAIAIERMTLPGPGNGQSLKFVHAILIESPLPSVAPTNFAVVQFTRGL